MVSRSDLEHAIRASTTIIRQPSVVIVGSQAVLGSWDEHELPAAATLSIEIDVCPMHDDDAESLATELDARIGELPSFHETHGFYIQGVGPRTALLSAGWRERLVPVAVNDGSGHTGLCLEVHDLCAAKMLANREKDHTFVGALIQARFVDPNIVWDRVTATDTDAQRIEAAQRWLLQQCQLWRATGEVARTPSYHPH